MNSARFAIAALMSVMVNAPSFAVGLITLLTIPAFAAHRDDAYTGGGASQLHFRGAHLAFVRDSKP